MFVIKPIKETKKQIEICDSIGCEYIPGTISFAASELKSDGISIDYYIGICQFIPGEDCEISSLAVKPGAESDEAVIILLRTVMSFLERCGGKNLTVPKDAAPESVMALSGLTKTDAGYVIDLHEFYLSPCKYNKDHGNT